MTTSLQIGNWLLDLSNVWVTAAAIILVLATPFILLTVWRRLHSRNPARAGAVMALNILAIFILLLLLIEPVREHLSSKNVIVISEGAAISGIPLMDTNDIYIMPDALTNELDKKHLRNANWLSDAGQLPLREPALSNLEILGFGLSAAQWSGIPDTAQIEFSAPAVPGFSSMQWSRSLMMGDSVPITGRFNSIDARDIIEVRLLDPADKLIDEQRILAGGHFDLLARPKSPGNMLYTLQAWRGDEQLANETVALFVGESPPQKILVEQSAPSYETLQLKNYATELGATLVLNSRISKGKSISQSVNQTENSESTFSPANLAGSDWLIIDGRALVQLNSQQLQWLSDAANAGLGVLVLTDESLLNDFERFKKGLLQGFMLSADPDADTEAIPQLVNVAAVENELTLPVATITLASDPAVTTPMNAIVSSRSGKMLVASRPFGSGNIALSLINQSHQWLTSGQRTIWSNYWMSISKAISRQRQDTFILPASADSFYRVNQRARICAFGDTADLSVRISPGYKPQAEANSVKPFELPLTADQLGSARKCGWYWPQNPGWQQLTLVSRATDFVPVQQSIYVYDKAQWAGQRQFEKVMATSNRLAKTRHRNDHSSAQKMVSEPLDTFWLWLLFIITASLLWLERKLDWDA